MCGVTKIEQVVLMPVKGSMRSLNPELYEKVKNMLSRGIFRSTIYSVLEIGEDKWNNLMSKDRPFKAMVLRAEQEFFLKFQEAWVTQAQEAMVKGDLGSMKEYTGKRYAEMGSKTSVLDIPDLPLKITVKHYTVKGKAPKWYAPCQTKETGITGKDSEASFQ